MASIAFASVGKLIELFNRATGGEDAYVRVLSANRLALGADPLQPTHMIDISREVLLPCRQPEPTESMHLELQTPPNGSRHVTSAD